MTVEFPIDAMRIAPNGRHVDLAHVAGIALYRIGPEGPREFWLYRVELRRNGEHASAQHGKADIPDCAKSPRVGCPDAPASAAR